MKLLSLLLIFSIIASTSFAGTIFLRPDGDVFYPYGTESGLYSHWSGVGGTIGTDGHTAPGYLWSAVDEASVDTTDYIYELAVDPAHMNPAHTLSFQNLNSGLIINRINSVTLHYYARDGYGLNQYLQVALVALGGNWPNYYGQTDFSLDPHGNWGAYSVVYATNPITGQRWTRSDVNNLQTEFAGNWWWTGGAQVAQVYATVDICNNPFRC